MAVGDGDATSLRTIGIVTATYFDFFDMKPVVGRFFNASEDTPPAGESVVVLAFGYWQSAYAGRTDVLGSTIRIGTGTYRVIGVAPPGFDGVSDQRVPIAFVPLTAFAHSINASYDKDYGWSWLEILVRRNAGVTIESANADLTNAYQRSWNAERALEPYLAPVSVARPIAIAGPIQAARGPLAGPESKVLVWISGVAVVVLLIACANVANLLLARAVRRRREMSLRRAIGGSRAPTVATAAHGNARARHVRQSRGSARRAVRDGRASPAVQHDGRQLAGVDRRAHARLRAHSDGRDRGARRNSPRAAVGARRSCGISQGW